MLELRGTNDPPGRGIHVDFGAITRAGMRQTPLGKALGSARSAIDATAGLCGDSYLLALLGCTVTAVERSPLLVRLAQDGLRRAADDPRVDQEALSRLTIVQGDALELVPTLPRAEAILLDPMFPQKRKTSALPRKEIVLVGQAAALCATHGTDADSHALFARAMKHARSRVLVKRADDSPPLVPHPAPSHQFKGRTSRVDLYVVPTAP